MKKIAAMLVCLSGFIISKAQDEPPPPPPPPPPPKVVMSKYVPPAKELKEFYKKNPDVASLYFKSEKDVVVVHKDKTQFTYNMKNKEEKDAFEEKYGNEIMSMPPPPPPLPKPPKPKKVSAQ